MAKARGFEGKRRSVKEKINSTNNMWEDSVSNDSDNFYQDKNIKFATRLAESNPMRDKNRALEILKVVTEITLIDDILDEGFGEAVKNICNRDKPLAMVYYGVKNDELLKNRDALEKKLQLL